MNALQSGRSLARQNSIAIAIAVLLLCGWSIYAPPVSGNPWPVERQWTPHEEFLYSQWIETIGKRQWQSTDQMIRNPKANKLFEPSDAQIHFRADCGDFPFVLRAYYAYKRRLPVIINQVDGHNYSTTPNQTISQINNLSYEGNAPEFFRNLPDRVSTATYRTAPHGNDTAFYPIAITREQVRPGAVFYDPNGHAAVVSEVAPDGTIKLIDAHPDQSVTRVTFGPKLRWRTVSHRGGFVAFRPIRFYQGAIFYENRIEHLPGFSTEQHSFGDDYHIQVQLRLATDKLDPLRDLENYIVTDTYQEVLDRIKAVDRGWAFGRETAIPVPANIYRCTGPWEDLSTPGRDIRLRISFLNIPLKAASYIHLAESQPERLVRSARDPKKLASNLIQIQKSMFDRLSTRYTNSQGQQIALNLGEIEKRLFRLSFDPNHPPELRWGATGREVATAPRDQHRYYADYAAQQRWRNRLEPKSGNMSLSDGDNPTTPPRHDISRMMRSLAPQAGSGRRFRLPRFPQ